MNSDRPLTRGEETALLLACIFLTALVAVIADTVLLQFQ